MKLFDRFKEWMGIRRLVRDLPQDRKPIARNLALARKVAIVYVVEDEAAHNHVRNYVKRVKEELGISNVMALGYSDQKVMPHYLHAKLNFEAEGVSVDRDELRRCLVEGRKYVRLEDGSTIRINYDAHNGYPYTAVGRILIERGHA